MIFLSVSCMFQHYDVQLRAMPRPDAVYACEMKILDEMLKHPQMTR